MAINPAPRRFLVFTAIPLAARSANTNSTATGTARDNFFHRLDSALLEKQNGSPNSSESRLSYVFVNPSQAAGFFGAGRRTGFFGPFCSRLSNDLYLHVRRRRRIEFCLARDKCKLQNNSTRTRRHFNQFAGHVREFQAARRQPGYFGLVATH